MYVAYLRTIETKEVDANAVAYEQIVKNSELGPEGEGYEVVLDHRPRAR